MSTAELSHDTLVRAPASPQAALTIRPPRAYDVAARTLVATLILSVAGIVAMAMVFALEAVLTWVLAIDCNLIIPLTTVALIRTAHPSWANFPHGRREAGRAEWGGPCGDGDGRGVDPNDPTSPSNP